MSTKKQKMDETVVVRIFMDPTTRIKVVLIPNRVDVTSHTRSIRWEIGCDVKAKIVSIGFGAKARDEKKRKPGNDVDIAPDQQSATMKLNGIGKECIDIPYTVELHTDQGYFRSEPDEIRSPGGHKADPCCHDSMVMTFRSATSDGPFIRPHPM